MCICSIYVSSHEEKSGLRLGPHTSPPYKKIGTNCDVTIFSAGLTGKKDNFILLLNAKIARRSVNVFDKEQSFVPIVNPRCLNILNQFVFHVQFGFTQLVTPGSMLHTLFS